MKYSETEKELLSRVNDIGLEVDTLSKENLIHIALWPYMDDLMKLLKKLASTEMDALFMQYVGVMKIMRMLEDSAQQFEKELGL